MEKRKIAVNDDTEEKFAVNVLKSLGYTKISKVVENGQRYVIGEMAPPVPVDENTSMNGWRVASSLLKLIAQVNDIAPKRKKASDGTIADSAHSSSSDHQPKIKFGGQGIVTAADITHDPDRGCDCSKIASSVIGAKDARIKYVIWNRKICSQEVQPWVWRDYNGQNPHDKHIHVSVRSESKFFDDQSAWDLSDLLKSEVEAIETAELPNIAWGQRVSDEFKRKAIAISAGLNVDPSELMAVMAFETGRSFDPSIVNPVSGATGLIQFTPKTAQSLGTTTQELSGMSAVDQLDYVEKYFKIFNKELRDIYDLYACVLWPRAIGKEYSYVLFSKTSNKTAYKQNKGLDSNDDGMVTKAEAASKVVSHLEEGMRENNLG